MGFVAMLDAQKQKSSILGQAANDKVFISDDAESKSELKLDRKELKSEVQALDNSVSVAIARLEAEASRGHNVSGRMAELEGLKSEIQNVSSALSDASAGFQLRELSKMESVIKSDLTLESELDDKDNEDDGISIGSRKRRVLPPIQQQKIEEDINNDSLFGRLQHRHDHLKAIEAGHADLSTNSTASIDDSKSDLMAAVALAGLMAAGYANRDKIEGFIEQTRAEMAAGAAKSGAADAAIDERIDLIKAAGKNISEAMPQGSAETQNQIADAAENIINLHINKHIVQGDRHFAETRAHLAKYIKPVHLHSFDEATREWHEGVHKTQGHIKHDMQAVRAHIQEASGTSAPVSQDELDALAHKMDGVFSNLTKHTGQNAALLQAHEHIFKTAHNETHEAKKELAGLLAGTGYRGDTKHIAHAVGIDESQLIKHVAVFQDSHDIPAESVRDQARRIAHINAAWKRSEYQSARGAVTGVSNA